MRSDKSAAYAQIDEWRKNNRARYTVQMPKELDYDAWLLGKKYAEQYADRLSAQGIATKGDGVSLNALMQLLLKEEVARNEASLAQIRELYREEYAQAKIQNTERNKKKE